MRAKAGALWLLTRLRPAVSSMWLRRQSLPTAQERRRPRLKANLCFLLRLAHLIGCSGFLRQSPEARMKQPGRSPVEALKVAPRSRAATSLPEGRVRLLDCWKLRWQHLWPLKRVLLWSRCPQRRVPPRSEHYPQQRAGPRLGRYPQRALPPSGRYQQQKALPLLRRYQQQRALPLAER
jgi:hypothetical protein